MYAGRVNILVDSTFLLPLVGVKVVGLPENPIETMISLGFNIKINEISLFEAIGKAVREAERTHNKETIMKRIEIGVKSLLLDATIERFPVCEVETINTAIKLYENLDDLPNCFIAATATHHTGLLLTESEDVKPATQKAHISLKIIKWKDLK
jgi:predicted nucleic acid-binding protein